MRSVQVRWLTAGAMLTQVLSSSAQQTPAKFTTATDVVRVDFVVTDKTGRIVPGVTMRDCIVKEDGKERPIVS